MMIEDIRDTDDESFMRHWAERAYDQVQLAQIRQLEVCLISYAESGWRSMHIPPPMMKLLLCATEEGVVLMTQNALGEWRTREGMPHRPPSAWMPAPEMPKRNGRGV